MTSPTNNHQPSTINKRIALITGASRGIGEAVAKRFAQEDMHVIAVARNKAGLEKLGDAIAAQGGTCSLVQLDLCEFNKIEQLAAMITERFGRLDVLVANAALLGDISPLPHISSDTWHQVMDVNLHANWHLLRTLDGLLRASSAGRVILVTSGVARHISPYWGAYAISKAALEHMAQLYAAENMKTNLRVNILDPKRTRTRMRAQAFPGEDPDTLPAPEHLGDLFVKLASEKLTQTGEIFTPIANAV